MAPVARVPGALERRANLGCAGSARVRTRRGARRRPRRVPPHGVVVGCWRCGRTAAADRARCARWMRTVATSTAARAATRAAIPYTTARLPEARLPEWLFRSQGLHRAAPPREDAMSPRASCYQPYRPKHERASHAQQRARRQSPCTHARQRAPHARSPEQCIPRPRAAHSRAPKQCPHWNAPLEQSRRARGSVLSAQCATVGRIRPVGPYM